MTFKPVTQQEVDELAERLRNRHAPPHEVVAIPSELIVGNRQQFKEEMLQKLSTRLNLVLDFSSCIYLDSSGLGVIYSLYRSARSAGLRLILCNLNEDLEMLFEITKMSAQLDIVPTPERALVLLSGG